MIDDLILRKTIRMYAMKNYIFGTMTMVVGNFQLAKIFKQEMLNLVCTSNRRVSNKNGSMSYQYSCPI